MTTHAQEQTAAAAVPAQATPVEPAPAPSVVDHVRSHSMKCYWDFVECRWQCSGE
jgi:hypothetical protein